LERGPSEKEDSERRVIEGAIMIKIINMHV
jgi:hypothetical protein